jgi:hypothetical protein
MRSRWGDTSSTNFLVDSHQIGNDNSTVNDFGWIYDWFISTNDPLIVGTWLVILVIFDVADRFMNAVEDREDAGRFYSD